jgi:hypothetical protein
MSFREKAAWITLVSVLLCFGIYFGTVFTHWLHMDGPSNGWLFVLCVGGFVVLQIGLGLAARWTTPRDGLSPRDEREQLIRARSHTIGYYVLVVLVLLLGLPLHLGQAFGHPVAAHQMMLYAFLDVVITGLVVSIAQIVMFRRGF